jgi:HK97 family phage portal protein
MAWESRHTKLKNRIQELEKLVRADDTDLRNPKQWFLDAFGGPTSSGATVTSETSLKFTAVLQAVSLRGSLLASFPKQIFDITDQGKNFNRRDPLYKLIAFKPNPWMNAFTFWELNSTYLDLWGNAYNYISGTRKNPKALSPIHPSNVKPEIKNGKLVYKVQDSGDLNGEHSADKILHFKDISTDGIVGKSRIALAREAIGLGIAAEKFGAEFFGKGGHSSGILEVDTVLGDEARESFKENWEKNANHGTPLLENGIKYKSITIPPDDAQFLATREFQVQDIARVYNIPPNLLMDLSHATFSNIEHQDIQFVKYSLRPTVERYEHELEFKLLPDDQLGEKEIRFNLDAMLRGDMQSRSTFYASAISNTWLSPNEVRAIENLNPREGGDVYENPNTQSKNNNNGNEE